MFKVFCNEYAQCKLTVHCKSINYFLNLYKDPFGYDKISDDTFVIYILELYADEKAVYFTYLTNPDNKIKALKKHTINIAFDDIIKAVNNPNLGFNIDGVDINNNDLSTSLKEYCEEALTHINDDRPVKLNFIIESLEYGAFLDETGNKYAAETLKDFLEIKKLLLK